MIIKRRYPNWMTGYDETEHSFNTLEELLNLDWIKNFAQAKDFFQFSYTLTGAGSRPALMAEYNKGKKWWVIGFFTEGNAETIGLPEWKPDMSDIVK